MTNAYVCPVCETDPWDVSYVVRLQVVGTGDDILGVLCGNCGNVYAPDPDRKVSDVIEDGKYD